MAKKPPLTIEVIEKHAYFYSLDEQSLAAVKKLHRAAVCHYGLEPVYKTDEVDEGVMALRVAYRVPGYEGEETHPNLAKWEEMLGRYMQNNPNMKITFGKERHALNAAHFASVVDAVERYGNIFDRYLQSFPAPLLLDGMKAAATGCAQAA